MYTQYNMNMCSKFTRSHKMGNACAMHNKYVYPSKKPRGIFMMYLLKLQVFVVFALIGHFSCFRFIFNNEKKKTKMI